MLPRFVSHSAAGPLASPALFVVVTLFSSLLSTLAQTQDTFSVFSDPTDIYPLPSSSACANALAAKIQCPQILQFVVPSSANPISNLTASDLSEVCTSSCYSSLIDAATEVEAACAGWPYILGDTSYVASLPFRFMAYQWNISCITQGSQFCVNIAQSNPSTAEPTGEEPPSVLCQNCTLQALHVQMSSAFGWDGTFVSEWESIQSTCGVSYDNSIPADLLFNASSSAAANGTSYNVTATPTLTPASANNCVYGTYTIKSGDTCQSITAANGYSYDQFVSINGLDLNCTKLPVVGKNVCSSGSCQLYTVQSGDTCLSIYQANNITWTQLLAYNPQLDAACSNIDAQVGKGICLSPPGGAYTPATTVAPVSGTPTTIAIPTGAIAPGADRSLCGRWYEAVPGDTCPQILQIFQITNDTFYALNAGVDSDCSNLLAGFEYCVSPIANTTTTAISVIATATGASLIPVFNGDFPLGTGTMIATGNMTVTPVTASATQSFPSTTTPEPTIAPRTVGEADCLQYYTVQAGDSCLLIETLYNICDDQFHAWNPEVDTNCGNIEVGLAYCVFGPYVQFTPTLPTGVPTMSATPTSSVPTTTTTTAVAVPTNVASGTITTGCTTYYTIKSGDSCGAIESTFSITLSQFISWNPEVNTQCTNIQVGLAYCVSGPASTSVPTLPGTLTTGCNAYYTVKSGDTCAVMETTYGITLDQIRQWNTEVDSNCANIQPDFGYCVSGPAAASGTISPSAGCTNYYTVVSGDSCGAIDSTYGITLAQFLAWNTGVNSGCTNIIPGEQYCVAGPASGATTTTTTTSTAAAPTGSGTITPGQGCKEYYTVVSGDTCSAIDTKFGITLAQFISWNPEINSQCTNVQLGVQYCVSGP